MRIFRFFYIIYIALRFGLDEFVLSHTKLKPLQGLIKVLLFWRNKSQARGERLRLALEALGPIFVKFGQMLSTRRDLIPLDIADELAKLQDQVPPFAFTEVEAVIQEAFNLPLNQVFSDFEQTAIASANDMWNKNADEIAEFESNLSISLLPQQRKAMWREHLNLTKNETLQLANGDYNASIDTFDRIVEQGNMMADSLAQGIIIQFPERFH